MLIQSFKIQLHRLPSEEVVRRSPRHVGFASPRRGVKDQKVVVHLFVYLSDAGVVAAPVAVIGRTENSYDLLVLCPIIALN